MGATHLMIGKTNGAEEPQSFKRRNSALPALLMKGKTKENLKIVVAALASIPVMFGIVMAVMWAGVYEWFDFVWWTGIVFGLAALSYGKGLKRARPLCAFFGMFVLHLVLAITYMRSHHSMPAGIILRAVAATLEATAVYAILMLVGGPPLRGAKHGDRPPKDEAAERRNRL